METVMLRPGGEQLRGYGDKFDVICVRRADPNDEKRLDIIIRTADDDLEVQCNESEARWCCLNEAPGCVHAVDFCSIDQWLPTYLCDPMKKLWTMSGSDRSNELAMLRRRYAGCDFKEAWPQGVSLVVEETEFGFKSKLIGSMPPSGGDEWSVTREIINEENSVAASPLCDDLYNRELTLDGILKNGFHYSNDRPNDLMNATVAVKWTVPRGFIRGKVYHVYASATGEQMADVSFCDRTKYSVTLGEANFVSGSDSRVKDGRCEEIPDGSWLLMVPMSHKHLVQHEHNVANPCGSGDSGVWKRVATERPAAKSYENSDWAKCGAGQVIRSTAKQPLIPVASVNLRGTAAGSPYTLKACRTRELLTALLKVFPVVFGQELKCDGGDVQSIIQGMVHTNIFATAGRNENGYVAGGACVLINGALFRDYTLIKQNTVVEGHAIMVLLEHRHSGDIVVLCSVYLSSGSNQRRTRTQQLEAVEVAFRNVNVEFENKEVFFVFGGDLNFESYPEEEGSALTRVLERSKGREIFLTPDEHGEQTTFCQRTSNGVCKRYYDRLFYGGPDLDVLFSVFAEPVLSLVEGIRDDALLGMQLEKHKINFK
jgi:exonuclease III